MDMALQKMDMALHKWTWLYTWLYINGHGFTLMDMALHMALHNGHGFTRGFTYWSLLYIWLYIIVIALHIFNHGFLRPNVQL